MGRRGSRRLAVMEACLAGVMVSACYTHTYDVGVGAPGAPVVYEHWRHHWIAGLVSPDHELRLDEICPSGNATVHQERSFLNGLVGVLTGEIYSPTTITIRCQGGRSEDLDLDPGAVADFVSDPAFLEWVAAVSPDLYEEARDAQQRADR